MTGLSVLHRTRCGRRCRRMCGGAHGKLLDADRDRFGSGDVQASRWKN